MRYHFNNTEENFEVIDSDTGNIVCFCYTNEKAKLVTDALNQVNKNLAQPDVSGSLVCNCGERAVAFLCRDCLMKL